MSKSFLYISIYQQCDCVSRVPSSDYRGGECDCEWCGVAPGKTKAPKLSKQSKHPTVYLGDGVFSVQYWQFHRCFVRVKSHLCDTGEDTNFCTKFDCCENRRLAIRNKHQFDCPHIEKVLSDLKNDLLNVK